MGTPAKVFGKIEVQVEASQVALLLLNQFVNLELREDHAPRGGWHGAKAEILAKRFLSRIWSGVMPASWAQVTPDGNFHAHTFLKRFGAIHYCSLGRAVT